MEKLKPLLVIAYRYRFWILAGLAVVLPPIGWAMANSALNKQIEERTSTLDSLLKGIESAANSPNQKWVDEVTKWNVVRKQHNQESHVRLWEKQQGLMEWPADIKDFMASCPYRGAITEFGVAQDVPDLYVHDYPQELRKLWEIVEPLDDGKGNMLGSNKEKKVKFEMSAIPRIPSNRWQDLPPTWPEIWDAQEDIWLLKALLDAVARVNFGTTTILDSHVKRIERIQLFGAERIQPIAAKPQGDATGDGPPGAPGAPGMEGDADDTSEGLQQRGQGGISAMQNRQRSSLRQAQSQSADFSLAEEFKNVVNAGSNKGRGRAGRGGGSMGGPGGGGYASMQMGLPTGAEKGDPDDAGAQQAKKKNPRYVDDTEELPFRTRGFYIKLIVDHRKIPDLLVELSKSPWPVEIVRVHYVAGASLGVELGAATEMAEGSFGGDGGDMDFEGEEMEDEGEVASAGDFEGEGDADDVAEEGDELDPDEVAGEVAGEGDPDDFGEEGEMGSLRPGRQKLSLSDKQRKQAKSMAEAALADPNLATVVIAGLMTLYNPSKQDAPADAAQTGQADPAADTGDAAATGAGASVEPVSPNLGVTSEQPAATGAKPLPAANGQSPSIPNKTKTSPVPSPQTPGTSDPNNQDTQDVIPIKKPEN